MEDDGLWVDVPLRDSDRCPRVNSVYGYSFFFPFSNLKQSPSTFIVSIHLLIILEYLCLRSIFDLIARWLIPRPRNNINLILKIILVIVVRKRLIRRSLTLINISNKLSFIEFRDNIFKRIGPSRDC